MPKGDVHVTWRQDEAKWAVEKEGASRAGSLHDQKDSAREGWATDSDERDTRNCLSMGRTAKSEDARRTSAILTLPVVRSAVGSVS